MLGCQEESVQGGEIRQHGIKMLPNLLSAYFSEKCSRQILLLSVAVSFIWIRCPLYTYSQYMLGQYTTRYNEGVNASRYWTSQKQLAVTS